MVGLLEDGGDCSPLPVLGAVTDIAGVIASQKIDRVVVALSDRRGQLPIRELLQAKLSGVRVEDAATTYERLTGKILLDEFKPSWLIFSDGFRVSRFTRLVKRGLRPAARPHRRASSPPPLMLLTALAVRLDSPGPVLYCAGTRRRERSRVHAVQIPLDAHRRGARDARLGARPATIA